MDGKKATRKSAGTKARKSPKPQPQPQPEPAEVETETLTLTVPVDIAYAVRTAAAYYNDGDVTAYLRNWVYAGLEGDFGDMYSECQELLKSLGY